MKLLPRRSLRAADVELDQSHVTAPLDGVVGRRSVHEAQGVKKGDALFWITAQAPLRIIFTVPESAMAFFPRGAKLELTTTDYPASEAAGQRFPGEPGGRSGQRQYRGHRQPGKTFSLVEAGHVDAGEAEPAMNLSEALDAALPEIPRSSALA